MANKYLESWRASRGARGMDRAAYRSESPEPPSAVAAPAVAPPAPAVAPLAVSPAPAPAPLEPIDGRLVVEFTGSSNIRRAELEVATSRLEVTFARGPRWRYANVTPAMLEEWRAAQSAGRWFHGAVKSKPQLHPATPVDDAVPEA